MKQRIIAGGDCKLKNSFFGDSSSNIMQDGDVGVSISKKGASEDYNVLKNKPSINGIQLIGNKNSSDLGMLTYKHATTAEWNAKPNYVPQNNEICIYDDYRIVIDDEGNEDVIKGVKIGDGNAYLIDLPFITDGVNSTITDHINNSSIHTNSTEKSVWYSKLSCDGVIEETLIFS